MARSKGGKPARPLEAVIEAGKQTSETSVEASTDTASKNYEKAFSEAQEQLEKAATAAFQGYDELTTLGKNNVDAFVRASSVLVKGWETLGKEVASYSQASVEKSVASAQALFGVKTLRELLELQSELTRETLDSWLEEGTKLGELVVNAANEAFEPIQKQVNIAVEKILKPIAA